MKIKLQSPTIFFLILSLMILSCGPLSEVVLTPANPDATPVVPATKPLPATALPSPTATLILPLAIGTPLPQLGYIFSSDNINNIVEIARWGGDTAPLSTVAFTPDGRILAAAGFENTVKLWDLSSVGEPTTLSGHAVRVTKVTFSPDGKTLASGSEDGTIKLWDVASGEELSTFSADKDDDEFLGVFDIVFSPDGRLLASVTQTFRNSDFFNYLDLWDVATGKQVRTWGINYIWGVAFSPDGKMLAFGNRGASHENPEISVSDVASGEEIHTFRGYERKVTTVAFSPDSKTLATGSDDYTIKLWDVASGQELHTLSNMAYGVDPVFEITEVSAITVAFSPDGKTLVSGSEIIPGLPQYTTITLWDVASGQRLGSLNGYTGAVFNLAFSPDGKFMTSDSRDGTIRLWGIYP